MDYARILSALGDSLRLRILEMLPGGVSLRNYRDGLNVNQITESVGGTQPNISHHLKILRDAGLVKSEKVRNNIFYYRNTETLDRTAEYLKTIGSRPE
jgi:ArsR family transcriptional regulator